MKFLSGLFFLIIVILLSYWSISHLLLPGFFPIHDNTQVQRVFEMSKSLRDGMFPVRWVSDMGYGFGYPIFNFYAPLAYYFGAFWVQLFLELRLFWLVRTLSINFTGCSIFLARFYCIPALNYYGIKKKSMLTLKIIRFLDWLINICHSAPITTMASFFAKKMASSRLPRCF